MKATSEPCIDLVLIGFGSVSKCFCTILLDKAVDNSRLKTRSGKVLRVVGVSDSSGALYNSTGLPLRALLDHKQIHQEITTFRSKEAIEKRFDRSEDLAANLECNYDVLVDASPVDLKTGGAGLACVKTALDRKCHVVLANKAPLVLEYQRLMDLAERQGCEVAFSATVCGGLPVVNVGQRDLVGAKILKVEGIFNSTSNYVLSRMEKGLCAKESLKQAQETGIAEADPGLDLAGYDTANKLVIIANAVLDVVPKITLDAVTIQGIEQVEEQQLQQELARGNTIRLVASAELDRNTCQYLYKTDEKGVTPTAAAVLRDIINLNWK